MHFAGVCFPVVFPVLELRYDSMDGFILRRLLCFPNTRSAPPFVFTSASSSTNENLSLLKTDFWKFHALVCICMLFRDGGRGERHRCWCRTKALLLSFLSCFSHVL